MKKILLSLALAVVGFVSANAQFLLDLGTPDTLKITQTSGNVMQYLSSDINNIDFTDPKKVTINTWNGGVNSFYRNSISDMRFHNRYSNPKDLLTKEQFGAYEGLFYAENCRSFDPYYLLVCLASDEMLGGGGIQDNLVGIDYLTQRESYLREYENRAYETIYRINELIKKAENLPSSVDARVAAHTKGEMVFLRAYHLYELATLYSNIQYVTDNNSWEQKVKTFSNEEIWGHIMLDLKEAINLMDGNLCPSLKEDGRVSRYAAEALLARAFLFYTGFYQGKHDIAGQEASINLPDGTTLTKQDVVAYLEDCINNSPFRLVSDYRNLWPYTNRYTVEANPETAGQGLKWVEDDGAINPEVLFKIRYNTHANWNNSYGPGYANTYALTFGHRIAQSASDYADLFPMGGGWGAGTVAPNLWDDWAEAEPNDMRRKASIQDIKNTNYYNWNHYSDVAQLTQYHDMKISPAIGRRENTYSYDGYEYEIFEVWMFHPNEETQLSNNFQGGSIHPLNLIRLSDVYLMHSELTGTTDGINKVRARAGLTPLTSYSLTALQQERRWELAFEGVRWNDMRRWGDDYCKQALDRQLYQPIIYMYDHTYNNGGLFGYTNYSERYDTTRGFFGTGSDTECAKAYEALAGNWTYGELNGVTYGTLKYNGATAEAFINDKEGLIAGYTLDEMKNKVNAADGEIAEFARMSIEGSTIYKITADGDTIATGTITLNETDNYDWRICTATISNGAVLGSNGCEKFDLIKLDDKLVLVDATSATTNGEAQFWVFRQTTNCDNILYTIANKKWSYAVQTSYDYMTGQNNYIGPWGIGDYSGSGFSVPMLYCTQIEGVSPEGLAAKAASWGITDTRDTDIYAYMQFNLTDKTVSKYTRDGQLIATGAFECEDDGHDIKLTVHNNATLFPYAFYGEGYTVENFYLRYSNYGYGVDGVQEIICLREDTRDSQFTFWTFCQRGIAPEELDDQLVINQYDKNDNPAADGCYFTISFKDGRNHVYGYECVDGTEIASSDGLLRVKAEKGSVCQKDLRVWVVNCNNDTVSITRTLTFNMDTKPAKEMVIWENPNGIIASAWDSAALRFSDNEGKNFPYIDDDVYWGQIGNDLHFTIVDAAEGTTVRVMNGWWSNTYYDNLPVTAGDFHFTLTEEIARDCSRYNGDGKDLDLLITNGQATISKVYYLKE